VHRRNSRPLWAELNSNPRTDERVVLGPIRIRDFNDFRSREEWDFGATRLSQIKIFNGNLWKIRSTNLMTGFSTDSCFFDDRISHPINPRKCGTCHILLKTKDLRPFYTQLWHVPHPGHQPPARHVLQPHRLHSARSFPQQNPLVRSSPMAGTAKCLIGDIPFLSNC